MLNQSALVTTIVRIAGDEAEPGVPDTITMDTGLGGNGLGLTSLGLIRVLVRLENELDIELDDETVMDADLRTVGDLVSIAERYVRTPS